MARKRDFQINRFDGGITDDIRDTSDLSRCAHVSHFDIYSKPERLSPMPGYTADQDTVSGGADDLQNYNIKAFFYDTTLYAVGTKSNGTGSKVFQKASPTTASWTASTNGEGSYDVYADTFLTAGNTLTYVTKNGGTTYLTQWNTGGVTDAAATLNGSSINLPVVSDLGIDGAYYATTGADDLVKIVGSSGAITDPIVNTIDYPMDIQSGDAQMGIVGFNFYPYNGVFTIWDLTANPNETIYKYDLGRGIPVAIGRVGSQWVIVHSDGFEDLTSRLSEQANNQFSFRILLSNGPTTETFLEINGVTDTNAKLRATRGNYKGAMLFYGRIPQDATPTTYKEGIWAIGRRNSRSPIALSLLLDTSTLGSVEGYYNFGFHHFFAHGGDGSVSRLSAKDGTYDITCVYESLVFGSENPYKKQFNGISVLHEDIPSGGSVAIKYRTDVDDSWTTLGTNTTQGDERTTFTRTSSAHVGMFQEIQFRVEVTGNIPVKNISFSYDETDDLPFNL